jgi:hypothetical protein
MVHFKQKNRDERKDGRRTCVLKGTKQKNEWKKEEDVEKIPSLVLEGVSEIAMAALAISCCCSELIV